MYKRLAAGICLATVVWAHSELEKKTEKISDPYLDSYIFQMPKLEEKITLPSLERSDASDANYGILGYKRFDFYKKE